MRKQKVRNHQKPSLKRYELKILKNHVGNIIDEPEQTIMEIEEKSLSIKNKVKEIKRILLFLAKTCLSLQNTLNEEKKMR